MFHPRALVKPRALLVGQAAHLGRVPVTGEVRVGAVERGHLPLGLGANHGPSRRFDGLLSQALGISSGVFAEGHRVVVAELVEQLRRWTPPVITGVGNDPILGGFSPNPVGCLGQEVARPPVVAPLPHRVAENQSMESRKRRWR